MVQRVPVVLAGSDLLAVDRQHVVSGLDVQPFLVRGAVAINVGHTIAAVVRLQLHAEELRLVLVVHGTTRRAPDADMRGVQLADHLVGKVVQIFVRADMGEQRFVRGLDGVPILPVHVLVVEPVLHHPPALLEDLLPLRAMIDLHAKRKPNLLLLTRWQGDLVHLERVSLPILVVKSRFAVFRRHDLCEGAAGDFFLILAV